MRAWRWGLAVLLGLSGAALAQEMPMPGMEMGMGHGPARPGPPGNGGPLQPPPVPPDFLEMRQAAVAALVSLTQAPEAEIRRFVRTWGIEPALRYYDVAPKAFAASMQREMQKLVEADEKSGKISAGEAAAARERLVQPPPPPPPPP